MEFMPTAQLVFALNIVLIAALGAAIWQLRRLKEDAEKAKKEPALTLGAEQLLHDLTRGPAVVRVEVIDVKNLLLRSPRGG